MLICKPKDNKILIEDKLNIISDLTQNDVIRDFEATGKSIKYQFIYIRKYL